MNYLFRFKKITALILGVVIVCATCGASAETSLPTYYVTNLPPKDFNIATPPEYTFRLPDYNNTFILLDDFSDSSSDRYVMCRDFYGMHVYDSDRRQKFDIASNDLAAFLNGSFLTKGSNNATMLPREIIDYINFNHKWLTEGGSTNGNCPDTYESVMGIGILSAHEYNKYCSRFGVLDKDGYSKDACFTWWTRSGVNDASGLMLAVNIDTERDVIGNLQSWNPAGSTLLRPTFYLKADFFRNNKIDVFSAGSSVLDMLNRDLTDSELSSLYTKEEVMLVRTRTSSAVSSIKLENAVNTVVSADTGMLSVTSSGLSGPSTLVCNLTALDGSETHITYPVSNGIQTVALDKLKNGIYQAHVYVLDTKGQISGYLGTQITVASKCRNLSDSSYYMKGFNSVSADTVDLIKRMGVKWVRWGIAWESIEKSGGFKFDRFDDIYNMLVENDINIYFVTQGANALYTENGSKTIQSDAQIDAFVNYEVKIAEHYPEIKYFEISNEPNDGVYVAPSEVYGKMLEKSSAALKKVNPDIKIIGGAIAPRSNKLTYLPDALKNIDYSVIDGLSVHPYIHTLGNTDTHFSSALSDFSDSFRSFGKWKGLYVSEIGFPTYTGSPGISETLQASELVKQAVYSDIGGYQTNLIYNFKETGLMKSKGEHTFGVVRKTSLEPKPAYVSMLEYYNRTDKFIGTLNCGENIVCALYSSPDSLSAVAWSKSGEQPLPFPGSSLYDLYGNSINTTSLTESSIYICGISKELLKQCASYSSSSGYSSITENYSDSLPQSVVTLLKENEDETNIFTLLKDNYNIGSHIIAEYKHGNTELTETQLLNVLYEINSIGKILAECYVNYESAVSSDATLINDFVYVKGISDPYGEVGLSVFDEFGNVRHIDQTTADANGNYAFTFPELNNIKNGTYSILTNSPAPSSVQEKTFSYIEQPLPKNVILADNNADFGILNPIAQEYERLINSDAYTKSSAEVWQCYFLDKWLKEFTGLVCVTSVNHTEEGYMITFSNYTQNSVSGTVIVGSYNGEGSFNTLDLRQDITISANSSISLLMSVPGDFTKKLFFWKDIKKLVPITNAVDLN